MAVSNISTLGISLQQRSIVLRAQSQIGKVTTEIGTGVKADVARALGSRMGEDVDLRNLMNQYDNYKNSIQIMASRTSIMAEALTKFEDYAVEAFNAIATTANGADSGIIDSIQNAARSALERIMGALNVSSGDRFLFSGVDIEKQPLFTPGQKNPVTGRTPIETIQELIGTPPTDAASAMAAADRIRLAFDGDPSIPAELHFEGTIYNGPPALDAAGNPNPRVRGKTDAETTVEYGIQANDGPFRDILRSLYMIASVDVAAMPKEARDVYVTEAFNSLSKGIQDLRDVHTALGTQQADLDTAMERNELRMRLLNERVVALETVDPYDAQARLTVLQQQLQASLNLTARLATLNISQYMT